MAVYANPTQPVSGATRQTSMAFGPLAAPAAPAGTNYNETGRTVDIAATVTAPTQSHQGPGAVTTKWINHVAIAAPRNGGTTHTVSPSSGTVVAGSTFTPTPGRFLVCVAVGVSLASTPTGWIRNGNCAGATAIYIWSTVATGSDSFTTTLSLADMPCLFHFFEFSDTTRFGAIVSSSPSLGTGTANPAIGGLVGTNLVMAVKAFGHSDAESAMSGVWTSPTVELVDIDVDDAGSTKPGYWASIGYQESYTSASYQPTCTVTGTGSLGDGLTFSLDIGSANDTAGQPGSFTRHVAYPAPRNATTTHTISPSSGGSMHLAGTPFTPTAGRLLLCVVDGGVTTTGAGGNGTAPLGWSRLGTGESEAVGNTGLYVFWKTAAGDGDSMVATHNGSDYPVLFHFFEFPTGSTFVNSVKQTSSLSESSPNPTLSGLTGTKFVMAAKARGNSDPEGSFGTDWNSPNRTALSFTQGVAFGFVVSIGYQVGYTSATYAPTCTLLNAANHEGLTFAVNVVAAGPVNYVETNRPINITATVTNPSDVVNPIVVENALPGYASSNWQVSTQGSGSIGDTGALGFPTAMSVQAGSTIDFKIHTGGTNYNLEIIRLGWYGGAGARLITTFSGRTGVTQPEGTLRTTGTGESSVGSRDCSNWSVTDSWSVPSDICHGVFLGVIKRSGQGTFAHVGPFIVHNTYSNTQSKITVKTSDMTWRAYNTMGTLAAPTGGKSLYGTGSGTFTQADRAWDVTYDAPLVVSSGVPQTCYWNGERPVHAFLERNGYDVSYVSCLDVDSTPSLLLGRQVIVSLGHDEYWSQNMRDAWDAAIASGVNAIVWSGNTMLWRVRMSGQRMFCYKNSHSLDGTGTGVDPVSWTGTWRDTRWSSRNPENRSIGAMFVSNGIRSDELILTAPYAAEPLWRGTTVAALTGGSTETLKADILGMEWDTYEPYYANSMRYPAGLKFLSLTPVNLTGQSAGENGSTYSDTINPSNHSILAYKKGTALVVNFGINQWGWGLSDFHGSHAGGGGTAGENTTMKQATVNLLADMGLQPGSIQSGLTPATLTAWTFPTASTMSTTATLGLTTGQTGQLAATTTWSNGITTDNCDYVTWGTSNAAVATVSATGLVTAVGPGTATITGTYSSLSDTTAVTVTGITTGADTVLAAGYSYTGTNYGTGTAIEVGLRFIKGAGITQYYVKGVRWWRGTNSHSAAPIAYIAPLSGANITSKTSVFGAGAFSTAGWEEFLFDTPVLITGTGNYVVWVWLPSGGYASLNNYLTTNKQSTPNALYEAVATVGGVFRQPPGGTNGNLEPTDNFQSSHYLVEPLAVATLGAFNETGLPVPITASVTVPTEQVDWKEPNLTNAVIATIASTGLLKLFEPNLSVPITGSVLTPTDKQTFKELALSVPVVVDITTPTGLLKLFETARSIPLDATVAVTAQVDYKSNVDLPIPVVGTIAETNQADFKETVTPLSVSVVVTTTMAVDQADWKEAIPPLAVPAVATFTAPTQTFTHFGNYVETGRSIPIIATVIETHQVDYKSNVDLSVPVVGTVTTPTDQRKNFETALVIPAVAAVAETNQVDFKNLALSIPIVATIDRTDNQSSPGHFDETLKPIDIGATMALAIQQADFKNLGLSVPAAADVTTIASRGYHDAGLLSVDITSTVTTVILVKFRELPVSFPITASVSTTDPAHFRQQPAADIGILAEVTVLDRLGLPGEHRTVPVVATVTATDRAFYHQPSIPLTVAADVIATSSMGYIFALALAVVSTIKVFDFKSRTGVIMLNDANAIYVGEREASAVYVGASKVWP